MKENNNYIRVRLSTIVLCILTILLCAAPCGARTVDSGQTLNVGYGMDVERIDYDWLMVSENATVNLYPGAYVDWGFMPLAAAQSTFMPANLVKAISSRPSTASRLRL